MSDVTAAQPGATEFVYVPYTYQDYPCRRRTYVFTPTQPNTVARRNERERRRVRLVNLGFARLRQYIPHMTKSKKLSKVETLRSAIDYIKRLQQLLQEQDDPRVFLETDHQQELNRYQEGCSVLSRCAKSSNWNGTNNLRADSNYCNSSMDDMRYFACSV